MRFFGDINRETSQESRFKNPFEYKFKDFKERMREGLSPEDTDLHPLPKIRESHNFRASGDLASAVNRSFPLNDRGR